MYIPENDRRFIENKYHRTDEPFDPYRRYAYHGYEVMPDTGLSDEEMRDALSYLFEATADLPHCLAKAQAVAFVMNNTRLDVNEHDWFPTLYNWGRLVGETFVSRWKEEAFSDHPESNALIKDYSDSGTAEIWFDTEHFVPDWDTLLSMGLPAVLERVKRVRAEKAPQSPEEIAFFDAMEEEYTAFLSLIGRFCDFADIAPDTEKMPLIRRSLHALKTGAPTNTLEALELTYLFFMCSEYIEQFQTRSIGNGLDNTLRRFYENDIANGTFTRDEIKSFLAYFLMQFAAIGHPQGHPFYLGGMTEEGEDRICDLSYDIVDVYESLHIYNPKIQIKVNPKTPVPFLDKVLKMIRGGQNSVVFVCQPGMIRSLTECYGTTYAEARDADISGCNEMHVKGDEACMIAALPNAAKAVLFVLNDGFDTVLNKQLGLATGDLSAFPDFDSFYRAFVRQFAHIVDRCIEVSNERDFKVAEVNPAVMNSALSARALSSVRDVYATGVKYPTSALLICSFATAVDSLMAVKKLVYDGKEYTLEDFREACNRHFEGYEDLRRKAKTLPQKFGNGDDETDALAAEIFEWFARCVTGKKNGRGGVYKVGIPSTNDYITQGRRTEATPDGRKSGEEFSKNIQPVPGAERNGAAGYLSSAGKLALHLYSEALVLDVMLHPSVVEGEDGLAAFRSILLTYMKRGGVCIQFNVMSAEMLREAQKDPEKYRDLQIRVTGWNALFSQMDKAEQDAYIERADSLGITH